MTQENEFKYANLADVITEHNISFEVEKAVAGRERDDKTYTFETHPFYSTLHDYSEVEFPDGFESSGSADGWPSKSQKSK